jgi:hypothetical protein
MNRSNRVISSAAALIAVFFAASSSAQPPSPPPGTSAQKPLKGDNAAAKAAKADGKATPAEAKPEKSDSKENAPGAEKKPHHHADPSKGDGEHGRGPMPGAHPYERGGFRRLGEDFRQGRVKKAELKERLAAMHETKKDRRRDHQKALERRWGATLAHPACREELRHHARREAFLGRALFLAQTEVTKDKEKVVERIEKLIAKEDERHARAMERLKSMPPRTGPSAMPSAMPSALPTPAGSAAKAGER